MNHPSMTSRGRRIAFFIAIAAAAAFPKRVECGYPAAESRTCGHKSALGRYCSSYEIEPLVFYFIENIADRNIGFAYVSKEDCR
jgi:hypothetical protein